MAADLYRRHAAECIAQLETMTAPACRTVLQMLAAAWVKLAEQAAENADLVASAAEPPQTVVRERQ
jgi:hypothetical protein